MGREKEREIIYCKNQQRKESEGKWKDGAGKKQEHRRSRQRRKVDKIGFAFSSVKRALLRIYKLRQSSSKCIRREI